MAAISSSLREILSALKEVPGVLSNGYLATAIAVVFVIILTRVLALEVDPHEPPVVKPTIPFFGHIIGLIRYQAKYHLILRQRTGQPIATLPMLNGKMYAIWDPALISAGLRNKDLSFKPLVVSSFPRLFLLSNETDAKFRGVNDDAPIIEDFFSEIHHTLSGDHLRRMNADVLELIAKKLDGISEVVEAPNLWFWIRNFMTEVTAKVLYGDADPFERDPKVEDALWDFERDFSKLFLGIAPSWIASAGHRGRAHLQKTLIPYYSARHDQHSSASQFVRGRANVVRNYDLPDDEIGRVEIMLPFAATVNTIPTLFWFFYWVFSRTELVERLRKDVESIAKREDGGKVVVDLTNIEEKCPLLMSCYRETLRMTNHQTSSRVVMKDTTISDGMGNSYLLKKGINVQMSIGTSHMLEEVWGSDVGEFNPDRFMAYPNRKGSDEIAKARRAAFLPFGTGKHLCPGRNFAFIEIISLTTTLLLGYDVCSTAGKGEPWKVPQWGAWSLVDAIHKPLKHGNGLGVKISRRKGWEKVEWKYEF